MGKPKKIGLSDLGEWVYSTKPEAFNADEEETADPTPEPEEQQLEAHFSNKGRGGKSVTLIKGFVGTEEDLKTLAKDLKNHCSAGGSVKNGEILIQGPLRDKIMLFLSKRGYKIKRIGG